MVEPLSGAPLFELLAQIEERQQHMAAAWEDQRWASHLYRRSLGEYHPTTLNAGLECLRLHIRASTPAGYGPCTQEATELSRGVDALAKVDLVAAQNLAKKCADLLGLCKLLEVELLEYERNRKLSHSTASSTKTKTKTKMKTMVKGMNERTSSSTVSQSRRKFDERHRHRSILAALASSSSSSSPSSFLATSGAATTAMKTEDENQECSNEEDNEEDLCSNFSSRWLSSTLLEYTSITNVGKPKRSSFSS